MDGRPVDGLLLVGGRLCLDFVNTVAARRTSAEGRMAIRGEKLGEYLDLLAWARREAIVTPEGAEALARESVRRPRKAAAVFRRAVRFREALYRVLGAVVARREPDAPDLGVLDEGLREARLRERLVATGEGFALRWSDAESSLDAPLWPVAMSAAELLTTGDLTRLRECEGADCGWVFEDASRNRGRKWCAMSDCGNAAKVRRFRSRQREGRAT